MYKKMVSILLTLCMLIPLGVIAEGKTLKETLDEPDNNFYWINETMGIQALIDANTDLSGVKITTDFGTNGIGDESAFEKQGDTFSIIYHDLFKDGEQNVTLKVDFKVVNFDEESTFQKGKNAAGRYYNGLSVNNTGHIDVGSFYTTDVEKIADQWKYNTEYEVTHTFYDGDPNNGGKELNVDYLVGIEDPDNADYFFDTNSNNVFFADKNGQESWNPSQKCSEEFLVESKGLVRNLNTDDVNKYNRLGGFDYAQLLVALNNESSFTFNVNGWRDRVSYPLIYKINKYTVTYLDGVDDEVVFEDQVNPKLPYGTQTPAFDTTDPSGDPVREGYTFMGWTEDGKDVTIPDIVTRDATYVAKWEKNETYVVEYYYQVNGEYPETPDKIDKTRTELAGKTVNTTDTDVKPEKEGYVYDEKAGNVLTGVVVAEGETGYPTTLKVYFKEQFTVIYQPGTQGTFPEKKTSELDYGVATPAEPDTSLHNEGYDFVGWSPEVEKTVTKNMTYVAQWKPWEYTIIYEPNGGSGKMDPNIYEYGVETMNSKPNEFYRDGYEFVGFTYTDKDGKITLYKSINDFKAELMKPENNRQIKLVAEWKKIPPVRPTTTTTYYIPITGVE